MPNGTYGGVRGGINYPLFDSIYKFLELVNPMEYKINDIQVIFEVNPRRSK